MMWSLGVIVIILEWELLGYLHGRVSETLVAVLSILIIPITIVVFVTFLVKATTVRCPHCSSKITLGYSYGQNDVWGFDAPKKCFHCGKDI